MKPKKKILKKKLKVKKSEKILVESESPEVNEADEVLNFQTEETVQVEDKFDRPIIDYSVFSDKNNFCRPKRNDKGSRSEFKIIENKSFGLTLLKSVYLTKFDVDDKLRELIDKTEDELWINPSYLVKNKSNNFSFTSLSDVTSKSSSKFKKSKKFSQASIKRRRKSTRPKLDGLTKSKSLLSTHKSESKLELNEEKSCCSGQTILSKQNLIYLKNFLDSQLKK